MIQRILKIEEIKPMIQHAPGFFPKTQEELDGCFVYLMDGFCYAGIKKIKHHQNIAEVEIVSNGSKNKFLRPSLFMVLLSLVHSLGFSRMAMRFQNERLKQICLKKRWVVPWGLGLYINKNGVT